MVSGITFRSLIHFKFIFVSMATHSSTLAWKTPWMEEPGRLQSMGFSRQEYWRIPWTEEPARLQSIGSHRVGHN